MIFVDTNLVSEPVRPRPNPVILEWLEANDGAIAIAAVVLAEVARGIARIRPPERAKRLVGYLPMLTSRFAGRIVPFDEKAALIYGEIMGQAERAGSKRSMGDGMIAAVALAHDLTLATRDTGDFQFPGLRVVNPWRAEPTS